MSVINTNIKALFGQMAMKSTDRAMSSAMRQLSTGKRVNSAADDAAGMAIATRMTQQIRSLNMAVRNAGDAVSLIQTAEGGTVAINDMMQRIAAANPQSPLADKFGDKGIKASKTRDAVKRVKKKIGGPLT